MDAAVRPAANSPLTVDIPPRDHRRDAILTDLSAEREVVPDDAPTVLNLQPPPPSLNDPRSDWERLAAAARAAGAKIIDDNGNNSDDDAGAGDWTPRCSLEILRTLPALARGHGWNLTTVWDRDGVLLHVGPLRDGFPALGLAVDLGTTTIAGALTDLADGLVLAVAARANPQRAFGDDVLSRIKRAGDPAAPDTRAALARAAAGAIDEILIETRGMAGVDIPPESVFRLAVAGNPTMVHLLLGLDAGPLAAAPFAPTVLEGLRLPAGELGLRACPPTTPVDILPGAGAYVGGDVVAGVLALDLAAPGTGTGADCGLFLDAGTNGEMVLAVGGRLLACSAAAGPAFEGARIECGMRAATGAVAAVDFDFAAKTGDLRIGIIDDARPAGLCGTGLLDAVAVLLDLGVVDATGRMLHPGEYAAAFPEAPPAIRRRLFTRPDGPAFRLAGAAGAGGADENAGAEIFLTQRDIREFQLAKGALAAGAELLLRAAGLDWRTLDRIWLAGGFGNQLRPAGARRVGLFDAACPLGKISSAGNAALAGARLCLLSRAHRSAASRLARRTECLNLSTHPDFAAVFAERMLF